MKELWPSLDNSQGTLTASGNQEYRAIPNSLPQAAPVSKLGINKPLGTLSPYVQQANRK